MKTLIEQIRVGPGANFAYIIGCPQTGVAALVDPAYEINHLLARAEDLNLKIKWVINTHGHLDHTGGNREVVKRTKAQVVAHELSAFQVDQTVSHQMEFMVGQVKVKVLHTPGHTPEEICLVVADKAVLTGDTLFVGECGRTDLPGSDPEAMHRTLFETLWELPDELVVYPGHDYGPKPYSTMGEEKATNYTLEPRSLEEFVTFMAEP